MLLAVVMGLLVVASLAAFVIPLRIAARNETAVREGGPALPDGTTFVGLDHLAVGVELAFDRQRWFVVGAQRAAAGWTAWHLDDRGQGGWMCTTGRDDEVLMAVRAEKPQTLDPTAGVLTWRDHTWTRASSTTEPVRVEGERRAARRSGGDLGPVATTDVERAIFVRDGMPTRRLVLERSVGEETWNAWIGTAVPGRHVDVWPPALGGPTAPRAS